MCGVDDAFGRHTRFFRLQRGEIVDRHVLRTGEELVDNRDGLFGMSDKTEEIVDLAKSMPMECD